jgi:PBP1b-binding outer membrane lipoprotein LpoB
MKKTKLFLTLILLNIILFSCSSDDNPVTQEPEPEPEETIKLVKTEKISDTRKVDYIYDGNDLLSSLTGVYNSFVYVSDFTYDSTNKITERNYQESGSSTYSDNYAYSYDANGKLSSYTANNESVNLEYNNNIVTVTGTIEGNAGSSADLELNPNGLVIKLTESNQYTNFEYDSNGNMTTAKSYDNSDNLLLEYTLTYDNKVNPFYGQLESIYIERFIEFFWEFEGIYISGFEGYSFPFLKNNITSISKTGAETTTYTYTYDSDDYPTNVFGDTSGNTITFDLEYY